MRVLRDSLTQYKLYKANYKPLILIRRSVEIWQLVYKEHAYEK